MKDWDLKIKKVNNGYILTSNHQYDNGEYFERHHVREITDNRGSHYDDLKSMKDVLYDVINHFHGHYSKHKKFNIQIEIQEQKLD